MLGAQAPILKGLCMLTVVTVRHQLSTWPLSLQRTQRWIGQVLQFTFPLSPLVPTLSLSHLAIFSPPSWHLDTLPPLHSYLCITTTPYHLIALSPLSPHHLIPVFTSPHPHLVLVSSSSLSCPCLHLVLSLVLSLSSSCPCPHPHLVLILVLFIVSVSP